MIQATLHLTETDLRSLPPVVDVPTAAAVLGIGRPPRMTSSAPASGPRPCSGSASSFVCPRLHCSSSSRCHVEARVGLSTPRSRMSESRGRRVRAAPLPRITRSNPRRCRFTVTPWTST
jgi:hypothetical protein